MPLKPTKKAVKKPVKPVKASKTVAPKKAAPTVTRARKVLTKTENDYEPVNRWWEKDIREDGKKWDYLEHHGLMFGADYEPHNQPVIYDGKEVYLPKEAEEVATHFAKCIGSNYETKEVFQRNFWEAFQEVLPANCPIKNGSFAKCHFGRIHKHLEQMRDEQKAMSSEAKKAKTAAKKASEEYYRYALIDDIRESVGAIAAEPPLLFRGRGEHPRMGMLKKRMVPEDVVLNMAETAPVPKLEMGGHCWGDIVHDNSVTWLGFYKDSINDQFKYIMLNANSGIKGMPDLQKYEKARKLKGLIKNIRADYQQKWESPDAVDRMVGVATYLIDKLALRAGNEKDTEEAADTVGCCSLRVEHVQFEDDNRVTFDFLGKDSIRYFNTVEVEPGAWSAMRSLTLGKDTTEMIFDKIDPGTLNDYFQAFMPGLSVKVFRTYNASITLATELAKFDDAGIDTSSPGEVLKFFNDANRRVAILCNHQKAAPKNHAEGVQKMQDQLDNLQKMLKELKKQQRAISNGTGQKETALQKLPQSAEACKTKIAQITNRITEQERKMAEKEANKTTSLGTSKANYMDPRISVAFCKHAELPIEKVFPGVLKNKFPWAMYAPSDFMW